MPYDTFSARVLENNNIQGKINSKNLQGRWDHALVIIKLSMRIKISIQRIVVGPR